MLSRGFFIFKKADTRTTTVAKGTDLLTAAVKAGVRINSTCGGEGVCGKCKVVVGGKEMLACETMVEGDLEVEVPKGSIEAVESRQAADAEEFTKGIILKRENAYRHSPVARKIFLNLPKTTYESEMVALESIYKALSGSVEGVHISAKTASVKFLSRILDDSDCKVTVTLGHKDASTEILNIEPGDTTKRNYGFAFDIGTTTVVGQLIDLSTRQILGSRIAFNKQAVYGSDVITRIIFASVPHGLEMAHKAVVSNINEIIADLVSDSNINLGDAYSVVCAGNMTMMHLLLRVDPANIRKPPYAPASQTFPTVHSSELGINANPRGIITFLPGVSTYLGGDIVSGILACGIAESEDLSMLVDIGTNGEIALGNKEWIMGAAASAGPAFEGSGLSCGMKAVRGAIQGISIDPELNVKCEVIGAGKARGICGSGYIDLLCQMLNREIIDKSGKINRTVKSDRIRRGANVYEFVVAFRGETDTSGDVVINEDDIENLKRSKGAIYSAIISLAAKVEKDIKEVKKIYIGGGFGNYLNIENAVRIGLLPDVDRCVYEFVGNSSLAGARMSLLSTEALAKTEGIYKNITYIDLSAEPSYMDEYIAALFFPHTDLRRFASAL